MLAERSLADEANESPELRESGGAPRRQSIARQQVARPARAGHLRQCRRCLRSSSSPSRSSRWYSAAISPRSATRCRPRRFRASTRSSSTSRCHACCTASARRRRSCSTSPPVSSASTSSAPLVMVTFTIVSTMGRRIDWNDASFGALVAAFPNTGYMGVPMLVALLGTAAAGPRHRDDPRRSAVHVVAVHRVVAAGYRRHAWCRSGGAQSAARGAAPTRCRGRSCSARWRTAFEVRLWVPVAQTVGLLADAASPVALFTIGAVLARSQMTSADRTPLADYVPVALKKLVLHPLLVLGDGRGRDQPGIPLDPFTLTTVRRCWSPPCPLPATCDAGRAFGADNGRIARIILVSTALAFVTFSAAVAMLVPK